MHALLHLNHLCRWIAIHAQPATSAGGHNYAREHGSYKASLATRNLSSLESCHQNI
jgi:hypothetical protein